MAITDLKRKQLVAKYMKTPEGRVQLSAAMNQPLKQFQDYEAIGRRALLVDPLANGDLPYYDKDVDTVAYLIGEDGESINAIITDIDRVFVPLFEVATLVRIPFTQLNQRRYDLEGRVKERTRIDVFRKEDAKIFSALIAAVTSASAVNPIGTVAAADITFDDVSDMMSDIEQHGSNRVTNIFINGSNITVFRKILKDIFDPITVGEIVKSGVIGTALGAKINVSPEIPKDIILAVAEPEFTGRLVESQPLTVLSADDPAQRAIGFSVFEQIGIYVQGHAVAGLKLT